MFTKVILFKNFKSKTKGELDSSSWEDVVKKTDLFVRETSRIFYFKLPFYVSTLNTNASWNQPLRGSHFVQNSAVSKSLSTSDELLTGALWSLMREQTHGRVVPNLHRTNRSSSAADPPWPNGTGSMPNLMFPPLSPPALCPSIPPPSLVPISRSRSRHMFICRRFPPWLSLTNFCWSRKLFPRFSCSWILREYCSLQRNKVIKAVHPSTGLAGFCHQFLTNHPGKTDFYQF